MQIIRENVPIPTFDIRTRNTFCALQLFLRIDLRNFLTTRTRTRTSAGRIASSMVVPSLNPGEYLVKILWLQYNCSKWGKEGKDVIKTSFTIFRFVQPSSLDARIRAIFHAAIRFCRFLLEEVVSKKSCREVSNIQTNSYLHCNYC